MGRRVVLPSVHIEDAENSQDLSAGFPKMFKGVIYFCRSKIGFFAEKSNLQRAEGRRWQK